MATALVGVLAATGAAQATVPRPTNGLIAFAEFDPDIDKHFVFTINPDGTKKMEVIPDPADDPVWAPDGSRLSVSFCAGESRPPCTMNPDGSGLLQFAFGPRVEFLAVDAWSPSGARVALGGHVGKSYGTFTARASDGQHLRRLTTNRVREDSPIAYSPDGSRLLVWRHNGSSLWLVRRDGTGFHRVSPRGLSFVQNPSLDGDYFSPSGRRIAFATSRKLSNGRGSHNAVFTVRTDGSGLQRITPWDRHTASARWSPNGRWISFEASDPARPGPQLYIVHPGGDDLRQLTSHRRTGGFSFGPTWSPDGKRLLFQRLHFTRPRHGVSDLWTIGVHGEQLSQVTDTPKFEEEQVWGTAALR